jgi:hypothetical protein
LDKQRRNTSLKPALSPIFIVDADVDSTPCAALGVLSTPSLIFYYGPSATLLVLFCVIHRVDVDVLRLLILGKQMVNQ